MHGRYVRGLAGVPSIACAARARHVMLEGIRVVELGTVITAPLTAMMLGDLGADVIKVERPEGDPFRRGQGGTYSATFVGFNRNKRSLVLDLTQEAGRVALLELLDGSDVLIDNFRPSVLGKLGLDPEVLRQRNPRLIHCSITGFGASGPYRGRPAFDAVAQALSGVSSLLVDAKEPATFGPTISDNATGMYACYGILGALVERARTGRGRRIEVNMLESSMAFIQDAFTNFTRRGVVGKRYTRVAVSQCFALRCADGRLIALHLSTREKFWLAFTKAIGAPELAADERFKVHLQRVKNYKILQDALAGRFLARTRAEWLERLTAMDVPAAPINSVSEALEDPQVIALGTAMKTSHPSEGPIVSIQCPVLVDGERPKSRMTPPPLIGEHTAEINEELARRRIGESGN